jgi:hypothetical protein
VGKLFDFIPVSLKPAAPQTARPLQSGNGLVSATEFVSRALEYTDTDFGRLVLLGSFRDSQSYQSAISELPFDDGKLHDTVAEKHQQAFWSWARQDTPAQVEDLLRYCRSAGRAAREMIAGWIIRADYSPLIPAGVSDSDRAVFSRKIGIVLATVYSRL